MKTTEPDVGFTGTVCFIVSPLQAQIKCNKTHVHIK